MWRWRTVLGLDTTVAHNYKKCWRKSLLLRLTPRAATLNISCDRVMQCSQAGVPLGLNTRTPSGTTNATPSGNTTSRCMKPLRTAPKTLSGITPSNNLLFNKSVIKYIDKPYILYRYVCTRGQYGNTQSNETPNMHSHMNIQARHEYTRRTKPNCIKHHEQYRQLNPAKKPPLCAAHNYKPSYTGIADTVHA